MENLEEENSFAIFTFNYFFALSLVLIFLCLIFNELDVRNLFFISTSVFNSVIGVVIIVFSMISAFKGRYFLSILFIYLGMTLASFPSVDISQYLSALFIDMPKTLILILNPN
jgi:hypothetical protein